MQVQTCGYLLHQHTIHVSDGPTCEGGTSAIHALIGWRCTYKAAWEGLGVMDDNCNAHGSSLLPLREKRQDFFDFFPLVT